MTALPVASEASRSPAATAAPTFHRPMSLIWTVTVSPVLTSSVSGINRPRATSPAVETTLTPVELMATANRAPPVMAWPAWAAMTGLSLMEVPIYMI